VGRGEVVAEDNLLDTEQMEDFGRWEEQKQADAVERRD